MSFSRASGLLLHPTSLPGKFGIGDLGQEAYRFADFLVAAGQKLWQMLPLGPTGYGNSPYQSLSVFAGNPLFISLEKLAEEGFLEPADLESAPAFPEDKVDYDAVTKFKLSLLRKSCELFEKKANQAQRDDINAFIKNHASWLEDYALFMALRDAHNLALWNTWETDIKSRNPEALARWRQKLDFNVKCRYYWQYQFFRQWTALKKYCNERNIKLIGDIPIFVSFDSAEVWSHPDKFYLDEKGNPTVVAGVPPDYFSKTGQLWGNPLYRWDVMAKDGYAWWLERLKILRTLVDIIRIDHFRGFEAYWEVPGDADTAEKGRWVPGPGVHFFNTIKEKMGDLPIIIEDLGLITPQVEALRDQIGLPGMRVLQFAFGTTPGDEPYRPYNFPKNCVVYTGTHDNNTIVGWFKDYKNETTTKSIADMEKEREIALAYLGTDDREIHWDFIRLALMSTPLMAIIPLQDVLGLGTEARMNVPGTTEGNWAWRFSPDMLKPEIAERLRKMTAVYGR